MPIAPFIAPERDDAFKPGRANNINGGVLYYSLPGVLVHAVTTTALLADQIQCGHFVVGTPVMVDQLAYEITAGATGNSRVGIYAEDADHQPLAAPLVDSGDIANTVAVKTFTPAAPVYLARGRYMTVYNTSVGTTLRCFVGAAPGNPIGTSLGGTPIAGRTRVTTGATYGAFPTPGLGWDNASGSSSASIHHVVLRISAA
jgi:hypothetical protein